MPLPDRQVPLVLGASGLVGLAVAAVLEEVYPETVSATRAEIDVTDRFRVEAEVERLRPSVVINCAGLSDLDGCEVDQERARDVNAAGAENAARAAAALGCRSIQISSSSVFDGEADRPYVESDPTRPLCELGRTRLAGEKRAAEANLDHLLVRCSWVYGAGRSNLVDTLRERSEEGGELKVPEDQIGSPTSATDLAIAIRRLLRTAHRGVVHFANAGSCSRFDLARAIVDAIGAAKVHLIPIPTAEAGGMAARSRNAALDSSLYTQLTGAIPRPWKEALEAYLAGRGRLAPAR